MLSCTVFTASSGVCALIGKRLELWTPIAARSTVLPAAVLGVFTVLTFVPARRTWRRTVAGVRENRGEVLVYVVGVGTVIALAFLVVAPH